MDDPGLKSGSEKGRPVLSLPAQAEEQGTSLFLAPVFLTREGGFQAFLHFFDPDFNPGNTVRNISYERT
jgi:hypothetical protein